ncbi:MAG: GNAT family N-acetyltransferase [Planctomycetaceae bacterium]|nr:GNAT family N-acetyltransferase [Planctomycetaceae bacterium]
MNVADRDLAAPVRVTLRDGREMTIRLLAGGDGSAIAEFYASIPVEDNRYYIGPSGTTPENARLRAAAADNEFEVALVLDGGDGTIDGEAWYRWEGPDAAKSLFGICLSRRCQNSGAGRAIMTRLLEVAGRHGPAIMTLTVQKENVRAVALYTRLGFQIIREQMRPARPDCPPLPEYYMELQARGARADAPPC